MGAPPCGGTAFLGVPPFVYNLWFQKAEPAIDCWSDDGFAKEVMERPDVLMVGRHCSWDLKQCFFHLQAKAGISGHST